jgi:hypothetical protein
MIHRCLELRPTAEAQKAKMKLVLLTVECKGLPPRSADSRTWFLTMPRQILKPRSLDFDPDASVGIRPSFEPKLLFSLLAFNWCFDPFAAG